jgi:hypothetical protein
MISNIGESCSPNDVNTSIYARYALGSSNTNGAKSIPSLANNDTAIAKRVPFATGMK